jgi:hypothetical protein
MGFDPDKIPIVRRAFQCREFPLADHQWRDIVVHSNRSSWSRMLAEISDTFQFEPHFGWKNHIERDSALSRYQPEAEEATQRR